MGRTDTGMSISIYCRVAQRLIYFSIYFSVMGPSHRCSSSLTGAILFGCILLKSVYQKNLDKMSDIVPSFFVFVAMPVDERKE